MGMPAPTPPPAPPEELGERILAGVDEAATGGVPVTTRATVGSAASALVGVARDENADEIVVGSHGAGRLRALLVARHTRSCMRRLARGRARRAELEHEGIAARVLDLYSIKPIDAAALTDAASATAGLVVAEDHWPEGGLAEAVLSALAKARTQAPVRALGVRDMPTSGRPEELLHAARIDAVAIADAARTIVGAGSHASAAGRARGGDSRDDRVSRALSVARAGR